MMASQYPIRSVNDSLVNVRLQEMTERRKSASETDPVFGGPRWTGRSETEEYFFG